MLSAYPVSLKFLRQGVQTQHQFLPKVPVKWYGPKTELKISKKIKTMSNDKLSKTFKKAGEILLKNILERCLLLWRKTF